MNNVLKKKCIVISARDDKNPEVSIRAKEILDFVIMDPVKKSDYDVIDTHQLAEPGDINESVITHLIGAPLVIANLSDNSPDVYYQMAIRHTLGKPLIPIAEKGTHIPFAVSALNTVFVDVKSPASVEDAKKQIQGQIGFYEKNPEGYPTPVSRVTDLNALKKTAPNSAVLIERLGKDMDNRMKELKDLITQIALIADNTRKPLTGILEIIYEFYCLLQKAKKGGDIWFLGMTLGFGPPHKYRNSPEGSISAELKRLHQELPDFSEMIIEINKMLGELINASPNATVICLKQDKVTLTKKFLKPLSDRKSKTYEELGKNLDTTAKEIIALHKSVEKKINKIRPVKYLKSIPLQIIAVDTEGGGQECLVFHIGTENINANMYGELGFTSRIGSVISMFTTVTGSYYESLSPKETVTE